MSIQGEWGVTAEQEAEENKRIQEFQETIPKMRSQLRVLTHLYQVQRRLPLVGSSPSPHIRSHSVTSSSLSFSPRRASSSISWCC